MAHIHPRRPWEIPESAITPEETFLDRRQVVKALGFGAITLGLATLPGCGGPIVSTTAAKGQLDPAVGNKYDALFPASRNGEYTYGSLGETPEAVAGGYNNFYEFTTAKEHVWRLAEGFPVDPWKVQIKGRVKKPMTLGLDDIFTRFPLEERRYRFRCVERWAMQVPWTGYPLAKLINFLEPLPSARYVRFVTFDDPDHAPGQTPQSGYLWPYYEALRLDEAMNELAFVAVGSYGHPMPMQHGAPWRILTPWKYGYKSTKSIVRIEFTERRPTTFWNDAQPSEYGFYSNINPKRPHPRWSQKTEKDIGTGERRDTKRYGGYGEQVAGMYTGKEV